MMHFVFCTDKNYLKGYGVLMLSILRFAPPHALETLRFHILSDALDDADKALMQGIAARRENTSISFYEPAKLLSSEALAKIDSTLQNRKDNLTRAAYYRLLAADLLPQDVRRALYLDGDVLCTGSIGNLFETDMKGCPAAMCPDPPESHIWAFNRLEYPPEEGYFNSGVMLLDLGLWRREKLTQKLLEYLARNAKKLMAHDQDLINACLHGRVARLDFSYNVMTSCFNVFHWIKEEENGFLARQTQYLPKSEWPALRAACEAPRLVHIWGRGEAKPWHIESTDPFTPVWRCFYAQSPWKNEPLQWRNPPTIKAGIKRLGRKALESLHLVEKRKPAGIPYPQEAYASAQRVLDEISRQSTDDS